jgi:hypothetical protein
MRSDQNIDVGFCLIFFATRSFVGSHRRHPAVSNATIGQLQLCKVSTMFVRFVLAYSARDHALVVSVIAAPEMAASLAHVMTCAGQQISGALPSDALVHVGH